MTGKPSETLEILCYSHRLCFLLCDILALCIKFGKYEEKQQGIKRKIQVTYNRCLKYGTEIQNFKKLTICHLHIESFSLKNSILCISICFQYAFKPNFMFKNHGSVLVLTMPLILEIQAIAFILLQFYKSSLHFRRDHHFFSINSYMQNYCFKGYILNIIANIIAF